MRYSHSNPRQGPAKRFLEWALQQETDECIDWPYAVDKDGYPQLWVGGRAEHGGHKVSVGIIVCTHRFGPPPRGAHAAHGCRSRRCINKRHLRWKSALGNNRDKIRDGTSSKRRLTPREVREIRDLWATGEWTIQQLAEEFDHSGKEMHRIITRQRWKSVEFVRLG